MDYCADHTKIVQQVGEINAKLDTVIDNQGDFKASLQKLVENGIRKDAEATIAKRQWAPARWFAVTAAGALILLFCQLVFQKLGWIR